ncbi:MAG: ATP-NAD kinase, partial [Streptosporangiales bacterium]|nr:ATP-NAD kinase [Streptosporangiales bacterium]
TARVAAAACGETPLLALSTGTNNAFPVIREATVAGLAAGLLAVGAVDPQEAVRRATALEVRAGDRTELALVDVCVSTARHVGARALWDPATLTELFCTFAEPDAVGLSSVAGLVCRSPRSERTGVAVLFAPVSTARYVVQAPIAPGLVTPVGVQAWRRLAVGEEIRITAPHGVLAVDGEREIEFDGGNTPRVRLRGDGPRCVDVPAVLAAAAARGLVRRGASG